MTDLGFRAAMAPQRRESARQGDERSDELLLWTTRSMLARRHPRAVAAMWAWQTALALLASIPAAGLARAAWRGDVHGDAPLWAPGGHALLDWAWHDVHGLRAALGSGAMVLFLGAIAGLVPMAALLIALAFGTRDGRALRFGRCVAGAMRAFPSMLLLLVLFGLVEGVVVGAGALTGTAVERLTHMSRGEARAEQLEALTLLVFLGLGAAVGVMHDLARAAVIRFQAKGLHAFRVGARTLRRAPLSLGWSWAWRALVSLAPVAAVARVSGLMGAHGSLGLLGLWVLHQYVAGARVALHASWLARALRAVDSDGARAPR